jgi:hypothetical protein
MPSTLRRALHPHKDRSAPVHARTAYVVVRQTDHVEYVIGWAEFVGAWLLVAGPLFQGSVELLRMGRSHSETRGRLPSKWWWLVPPVMYGLTRRRFVREGGDPGGIRAFRASGTSWFIVSLGGALLAAGQTWDVVELMRWHVAVFWVLYVVLLVVSVLNTSIRMIREAR